MLNAILDKHGDGLVPTKNLVRGIPNTGRGDDDNDDDNDRRMKWSSTDWDQSNLPPSTSTSPPVIPSWHRVDDDLNLPQSGLSSRAGTRSTPWSPTKSIHATVFTDYPLVQA